MVTMYKPTLLASFCCVVACTPSNPADKPPQIEPPETIEDNDNDGVAAAADCDDVFRIDDADDGDCDGIVTADDCDDSDPSSTSIFIDNDCDGIVTAEDCDDSDSDRQ